MFGLMTLACALNRHKIKSCNDTTYCTRNRELHEQQWILDPLTTYHHEYYFTAIINDNTHQIQNLLNISFLKSKGIHFKFTPLKKESFNRFDCTAEDVIVKQEVVKNLIKLQIVQNETLCYITANKESVVVYFNPFKMIVTNTEGNTIVLNPDDSAIIEHHISQSKFPEYYKASTFEGQTDYFKNGPTSVAFTFRFIGSKTRLSGLPIHTLPVTLPPTVDRLIRFFNSDQNHRFSIGQSMAMFSAIPFLLAHGPNHNSGLFWANPSETWVNISYNNDYVESRFISEGGYLDFFLFGSKPKEILDSYTQLTGRPMLPPKFGLGYHQSRWGYKTQDEVIEVSQGLDKEIVPHESIFLDMDYTDDRLFFIFHPNNFQNPTYLLNKFRENDRHIVVVIDPHFKAKMTNYVYKQAFENKYNLMRSDGYEFLWNCWPGRSAWVDFFNPNACEWWKSLYRFDTWKYSAKNLHVWHSMNEISLFDAVENTAPRDIIHYNNIEEREVHNAYGAMMSAATFDGMTRRSPEGERPFVITRSMFAGSQRYTFAWGGNSVASWEQLRASLQIVLSTSISGYPYIGNDVGGFFDSPSEELLSRWFALSAWTEPFFRTHCHHLAARREVNHIKDKGCKNLIRESIQERYKMLPYWYTLSREANESGSPIVRPMWWEFDDEELLDVDSYAMLGRALLVAPFLREGKSAVEVFLPHCRWYDFRTLKEITDKGYVKLPFSHGKTAVLLRGGYIVPYKEIIRKSSKKMFYDPFCLSIGLDDEGKAEGELYEDDGESLNFAKGEYIHRKFKFDGSKLRSKRIGGNGIPNYDVLINRITIGGVLKSPKVIEYNGKHLDFEYNNKRGIIAIKKPNVPVSSDWEIVFNY